MPNGRLRPITNPQSDCRRRRWWSACNQFTWIGRRDRRIDIEIEGATGNAAAKRTHPPSHYWQRQASFSAHIIAILRCHIVTDHERSPRPIRRRRNGFRHRRVFVYCAVCSPCTLRVRCCFLPRFHYIIIIVVIQARKHAICVRIGVLNALKSRCPGRWRMLGWVQGGVALSVWGFGWRLREFLEAETSTRALWRIQKKIKN